MVLKRIKPLMIRLDVLQDYLLALHISFLIIMQSSKIIQMVNRLLEETLNLHNVVILIQSVLNKIKINTTIIYSDKNVSIIQLKKNDKTFFDIIIMQRFGNTKVAKEECYGVKKKKKKKNWDVNVDNIAVTKLIKPLINSDY